MGFKLRPGTSVFGNVTFTPGTNENYVAPPTHGSVNVALTATSTASTHIGDRPPSLAHDGIIGISDTDGSTISNLNAWVTTGEGVGAWMQLDWSTPQTVNKIKLYDRPNVTHDHIKGGTLTFSDGSSVTVGELPDGVVNGAPDPLEVTFDAKTITWVRFTVDAFTGHNAGLTEFEVWSVLAAPAPAPAPAPSTLASWAVVGVQYADLGFTNSGAVYVYDVSDLSVQPTKLVLSGNGRNNHQFGSGVAATADKIVVGVPHDDDNGTDSGAVYVYDANDLSATPTKLTAFDGAGYDRFGKRVAATSNKIVVGAETSDVDNVGAVYVYDANDLSAQPTKLTAFDGAASDMFGYSVAASADKIVVGARYDDDKGSDSGSVYVYDANDLSAQPTKLTAFDGAQVDWFGHSVAVAADKIVVGAYGDDDNGSASGAVYVYDANDLSATPTKLTAFDAAAGDYFGWSVAVTADKIMVGAYRDDDNVTDSGSVYIYDANDLSAQPTKIISGESDNFGISLAAFSDKIIVGASMNNNYTGTAYVYDVNDLSAQPTKLLPSDLVSPDWAGFSVAIG